MSAAPNSATLAEPAEKLRPYERCLKRPIDLFASIVLSLLLSPLLLAVGCAVWLTSGRPILYRQRRLGLGERPFTLFKFRTMQLDADRRRSEYGANYESGYDPRTAIGRWLRPLGLDELPQLINVLRGEMSLIGPRPYVGYELEDWLPEDRRRRASVRPGISGLAQVSGRSSLTKSQTRECDLQYVSECGVVLDVRIALRTVKVILVRSGGN